MHNNIIIFILLSFISLIATDCKCKWHSKEYNCQQKLSINCAGSMVCINNQWVLVKYLNYCKSHSYDRPQYFIGLNDPYKPVGEHSLGSCRFYKSYYDDDGSIHYNVLKDILINYQNGTILNVQMWIDEKYWDDSFLVCIDGKWIPKENESFVPPPQHKVTQYDLCDDYPCGYF